MTTPFEQLPEVRIDPGLDPTLHAEVRQLAAIAETELGEAPRLLCASYSEARSSSSASFTVAAVTDLFVCIVEIRVRGGERQPTVTQTFRRSRILEVARTADAVYAVVQLPEVTADRVGFQIEGGYLSLPTNIAAHELLP